MTVILNDPSWWPFLDWDRIVTYFVVASSTAVVYDWALTLGQELELVWRQRWSLMTVLYICVRYAGILYSVYVSKLNKLTLDFANKASLTISMNMLWNLPISITDVVGVRHSAGLFLQRNDCISCTTIYFIRLWTPVVVNAMLGVIMTTWIHAMYQRSTKIRVVLIIVLLVCTIASGVMTGMGNKNISGEELILSGNHLCATEYTDTRSVRLNDKTLIPTVVWEIIAFFVAAWIIIKHFCELRRLSTGSTLGGCFGVLIKSHVRYFVAFAAMSCFNFGSLSPKITNSSSVGSAIYSGVFQIAQAVQMFVLGPRLILSVREYHAKLVGRFDEGTGMTTIIFQSLGHLSTSGSA
ncbi:hypothetical protein DFH29DRAFT_1083460 [Suillus ampliporus]|nr:hypothetical protein DFH29DRAFT_1083460 [Suillus ampliporus]